MFSPSCNFSILNSRRNQLIPTIHILFLLNFCFLLLEIFVKLVSIEEDNENESHFFNVEESIGSSNKGTSTNAGTSHEENVRNSGKVVSR